MTSLPADDPRGKGVPAAGKVMSLRYAGVCDTCGVGLAAGARAAYLRPTRTVRCLTCFDPASAASAPRSTPTMPHAPEPVETGTPGASARREYERRSARREARVRESHPRLGGLILALTEEPQSTTAWAGGARGEELLGMRLDGLAAKGVRLLHDRRIPGTKANIDHIAVGPTGVHVIDAKRYPGRRPSLRVEGGLFRPRVQKLMIGSRDRTRLVEGAHKQVDRVRSALDRAAMTDVPVHAALCFIGADWPLVGGSFVIGEVAVVWPRKLLQQLTAPGRMTETEVETVHRVLAQAFPAA